MLRVRTIAGPVVFGAWVLSAVACNRAITAPREGNARPVTLADFARRVQEDQVDAEDAAVLAAAVGNLQEDPDTPTVWFDAFDDREVLHPARPGDVVIVDSLVGHVNGRPIFADEFLEPIEDRLMRAAAEHRGPALERMLEFIIPEWLQETVLHELPLAASDARRPEPRRRTGTVGPVRVAGVAGRVTGRTLGADGFLEPVEDRRLRAADGHRGSDLDRMFEFIITEWLQETVLNELILAESEASLTEQEQMGLFAMLNRAYDEEIRKGGGTKSGAERRRQREGDELDQYLGKQKDLVLIDRIRMAKIQPRVVVTWRDVEREYQRYYEDFNPAATVTLARIRINTETEAALIENVTRRLAAGESFAVIAEELGFRDGGRLKPLEAGPGGITDIEVSPEMKEALTGLVAGDTSPPFQLGSGTLWLHVVALEQPRSRSIYDPDVQMRLKSAIRLQRSQIEWKRYTDSLLKDGVHDDLERMADRLFEIARSRYAR